MYVKYNSRKHKPSKAYDEAVKNGLDEYIRNEENIYKSISDEESKNTGCDVEASFLCHGIWEKLMNNNNPLTGGKYFVWSQDGKSELVFHFDIMNNPSEWNNKYSCGLFKQCGQPFLLENVKEIYHSIGNMTPIPWFATAGGNYIDGQLLHHSLDERWDLYLQILKDNWNRWMPEDNDFSFEQYMMITCQQVYYQEIYDKVKDKKLKDIVIEDINNWNQEITSGSSIVSLMPTENEKIDDVINKIITLIKLRCRIIYLLLKV